MKGLLSISFLPIPGGPEVCAKKTLLHRTEDDCIRIRNVAVLRFPKRLQLLMMLQGWISWPYNAATLAG
jgi:hypothetical protein